MNMQPKIHIHTEKLEYLIGKEVFDQYGRRGVVVAINTRFGTSYPIEVKFEDDLITYTISGYRHRDREDLYITLTKRDHVISVLTGLMLEPSMDVDDIIAILLDEFTD